MTDLLGTCTAWGDGVCVVAPAGGPPVTIALADIVSGKPVPPRPSVRHRVSARDAELHVLSLWPGEVETQALGDWLLRAAPPYDGRRRRRANSVLAMGSAGKPTADAVAAVVAFYAERDRPALAQVEAGSETEAELLGLGWTPLNGEADFMIASVAQVLRHTPPGDPGVCLTPVHTSVSGTRADGRARGRAALEGDWVGLHSLWVDPDHRRAGLGAAMVADLLDWGASQGATTAWLHVETDNAGAIALYESLGFRTHHTVRYLEAGAPNQRSE